MNEQQPNYERYLPGDEVRLKVQLRHHRVHLRTVDAVFRMAQGSEEAELRAEDEGVRTISTQVTLEGRGIGFQSEAELSMRIQRWTPPGVYKLAEIVVETYGGQSFSYEADEEDLGELSFEVVEEPDEKPALMVNVLPHSGEISPPDVSIHSTSGKHSSRKST
jgi:hypothetical protein